MKKFIGKLLLKLSLRLLDMRGGLIGVFLFGVPIGYTVVEKDKLTKVGTTQWLELKFKFKNDTIALSVDDANLTLAN